MDIDEPAQQVDYLAYFDPSHPSFPWNPDLREQIQNRRVDLSDLLIFDILLRSGGIIFPDGVYPPSDVSSLEVLLDAIRDSTYDLLKKDCLIYFLLKWHMDGREDKFMEDRCIPPQFSALADAYWHLDTGLGIPKAVSLLSDARLNRDYASKILEAISLADDPYPLVLRYVRTAKPPIIEPRDLELYTKALCHSSLLEAWQFQRSFEEDHFMRTRLFNILLDWSLSPKPRRELSQLISFPLSHFEQSQLRSYALNPPSSCPPGSIPFIQDLVCVRLIQSGQYASAIKADRQFAAASSSSKIKFSDKAQANIDDRKQIMDDLMSVMPAVERALLETELSQGGMQPSGSGDSWANSSVTLSSSGDNLDMSWEDISRPVTGSKFSQPPKNASAKKPSGNESEQSQRTNVLLFVGPQSSVPQGSTLLGQNTAQKLFTTSSLTRDQARPSLSAVHLPPSSSAPSIPSLFGGPTRGAVQAQQLPTVNTFPKFPSLPSSQNQPQPRSGIQTGTLGGQPFVSANATRNAFYKPPSGSLAKRPSLPVPEVVIYTKRGTSREPASVSVTRNGRGGNEDEVESSPDADASMEMDGDVSMGNDEDDDEEEAEHAEEEIGMRGGHLDYSVFSGKPPASSNYKPKSKVGEQEENQTQRSPPKSKAKPKSKARQPATKRRSTLDGSAVTQQQTRAPPGAFVSESEGEPEREGSRGEDTVMDSPPATRTSTRAPPRRPRIKRPKAQEEEEEKPGAAKKGKKSGTNTKAERLSKKIVDLGRSLPGSLMSEDERDVVPTLTDGEGENDTSSVEKSKLKGAGKCDEDDEEGENLGPLPPPSKTAPRRAPRTSKADTLKVVREESLSAVAKGKRPMRRSTRLSSVMSSQSPEPSSPKKKTVASASRTRTSTRISTGGERAATKSSTRKKRMT